MQFVKTQLPFGPMSLQIAQSAFRQKNVKAPSNFRHSEQNRSQASLPMSRRSANGLPPAVGVPPRQRDILRSRAGKKDKLQSAGIWLCFCCPKRFILQMFGLQVTKTDHRRTCNMKSKPEENPFQGPFLFSETQKNSSHLWVVSGPLLLETLPAHLAMFHDCVGCAGSGAGNLEKSGFSGLAFSDLSNLDRQRGLVDPTSTELSSSTSTAN